MTTNTKDSTSGFIPCRLHAFRHITRWESLQPGHTYFPQHGWLPLPDRKSNKLTRLYKNLLKIVQMKDVRYIALMNSSVDCVPQRESPIPGSLGAVAGSNRILLHIRHRNTLECGLPVLSQTRSSFISFSPPLGPSSLAIFISHYPVLLTPPKSSRVLHLPLFLLKRLYFRTSKEDVIKAGANLAVRATSRASRVLIELSPGYWLFVIAI